MAGSYNGITIKPIQSVSISETPEYTEGGKTQKYIFSITVAAKHVAVGNHASIVSFVSGLSALMVDNGLEFSISGPDGANTIRFKPRVKSVNVKEDIWVDFCDYTIEMEADKIYIGGTPVPTGVVSSVETDNSWSIEFDESEPRFSKISHKLSVKAKTSSETGTEVKGWITAKAKLETLVAEIIPATITTASGGVFTNPHNKKTSKTLDITNGVATAEINISYHNKDFYDLTLPQDAYAYHDQTVTEKIDSNSLREVLSIEGTITGLKQDPGGNRYSAANTLWGKVKTTLDALYANLVISSRSLSEDQVKGIINYSYEVQNKKKPSGAFLSETINITYQGTLAAPPKVIVIHNTITGGAGPIFQDIETKKARSMTITIERVGTDEAPDTLTDYGPEDSEIESDVITFTATSKKISRTTTFIWSSSTDYVLPTVSSDYDLLTTKIPRPYE